MAKELEVDNNKRKSSEELAEDSDSNPKESRVFTSEENSEHDLDDLASKDSTSQGNRGKSESNASHIPHINTLGSQIVSGSLYGTSRKSGSSRWHIIALGLIGLLIIGATIYLLKQNFTSEDQDVTPSPAPTTVITETPTPTPKEVAIDRSKLKVRVLNGTPKTGLAAQTADKLKGLGYQIENTANASNSAFARTIVRIKSEDQSLINLLIKDLSYAFDATGFYDLKSTDTVDIEVILGAK